MKYQLMMGSYKRMKMNAISAATIHTSYHDLFPFFSQYFS